MLAAEGFNASTLCVAVGSRRHHHIRRLWLDEKFLRWKNALSRVLHGCLHKYSCLLICCLFSCHFSIFVKVLVYFTLLYWLCTVGLFVRIQYDRVKVRNITNNISILLQYIKNRLTVFIKNAFNHCNNITSWQMSLMNDKFEAITRMSSCDHWIGTLHLWSWIKLFLS